MISFVLLVAYVATVPAANWMVGHIGTVCVPNGPCLVPVAPGLMAPSGVAMAALALVFRDLVQRRLGLGWGVFVIAVGAMISFALAPASLVVASTAAFVASEVADMAAYTPLQRRGLALAVLTSGVIGLLIDSALFLWLAFGSLDHLAGQIVGKLWAVGVAALLIRMTSPAASGFVQGGSER